MLPEITAVKGKNVGSVGGYSKGKGARKNINQKSYSIIFLKIRCF
jgi:hypothetical protein